MAEDLAAQIVASASVSEQIQERRRGFKVLEVGSDFVQVLEGGRRSDALLNSKRDLEGLLNQGWRIESMAPATAFFFSRKAGSKQDDDLTGAKFEPILLSTSIVILFNYPNIISSKAVKHKVISLYSVQHCEIRSR